MIRERMLRTREKLVGNLPITGELLRGSLLARTVRHTRDCPKFARVRTRQFSVRRERIAEVRRWLSNYQEHDLLRPERGATKTRDDRSLITSDTQTRPLNQAPAIRSSSS
jgi:hypothetical protein